MISWREASVLVVGAGLTVAGVAEAVVRAVLAGSALQLGLVLVVFAVGATLPVALLPPGWAVFAVTVAVGLSLVLFGHVPVAGVVAELVVLLLAGRVGRLPLAVGCAAPFVVVALVWPGVVAVVLAALAPAAALAGALAAARADAVTHQRARLAIADSLVDHTARGERARIARELHDVVAHHISMIAVQAETARLTTPGLPPAGASRLSEIGDTARAGLIEMRRLLGVLREDAAGEAAGEPMSRQPQPGVAQLFELVDQARETSGVGVRLIMSGAALPLDPGTGLAVYRIVQEGLTNARRHAPGAAVDVELWYSADAVRVRVRDNGPGDADARPRDELSVGGHGLSGMRERASAVGGAVRAGPMPAGGFLVEAVLPVRMAVAA